MLLYLVRHGEALPGLIDAQRPLSEKGLQDAEKLAGFFKKNNIQVSAIFQSGLKRAKETAEIISKGLGKDLSVTIMNSLAPEDPVQPICKDLENRTKDIMLVGHLPSLASLVSQLLLGSEKDEIVDFKKGAVIVLERDKDKTWKIRWFLTPKQL